MSVVQYRLELIFKERVNGYCKDINIKRLRHEQRVKNTTALKIDI